MEFPVAPKLPNDVLSKQTELPVKPDPVTLEGERVRLVPLDTDQHLEALYRVSNGSAFTLGNRSIGAYDADEIVWRYMSDGPFDSLDKMKAYLVLGATTPNRRSLCVIDQATDHPIGVVNFMANFPQHLKIELGGIWYSPIVQRTGVNTESTYLMLNHLFGLGYRRVEWKCDALNERSRRSALRFGFEFEGIQRYHYVVKGRSRDTAWFRILDHEWPEKQSRLET